MRKYRFSLPTLVTFCSLISLLPQSINAEESARLISYAHDGQTNYAMSLMADLDNKEISEAAIVVLFDTSASQQGEFRQTALLALETFLGGLNSTDRVELFGVDLNSRRYTTGFVAPNSSELQAALSSLESQIPLGSTDMVVALESAFEVLKNSPMQNKAVVYIGDGVSTANLLDTPTLKKTIAQILKKES